MVKILSIGDFHGKFPSKLKKIAKSKEIDIVLSVGDFFPWSMKKEFFKHCYGKDVALLDVLGKKEYKKRKLKDLKEGERVIMKFLNTLDKPVITIVGNYDSSGLNDQYTKDAFKEDWKWAGKDFFSPMIKKYKNIERFEYSFVKIGDIVFIGGFGHSSPGRVKSKAYKRYRKKLEKLFKKFSKENKKGNVIFVTHNVPYDTKLDKITAKDADKKAKGKHYGSKMVKRIIEKYQPSLHIAGHMHENQGKDKIGKTISVNNGAVLDGKAAIIDFDEERGKVKNVKFVK